jgi:drug/metabolite transporter (DMT)-like permease
MMFAIFAGSAAAVAFGVSTLCSARSSRSIGAASTVGWVAMIGLAITLPFIVATSVPPALTGSSGGWLLVSGVGNARGLLLAYQGLRVGKVGVVGPILSTEGAVAALLAVAAGQQLGVPRIAALSVIAVGIALAGIARSSTTTSKLAAGAAWAAGAALAFGVSLYATGRAGAVLPLAWALLPPRIVGTAALALPLLAARRLRLTRRVAPLVLTAAGCEVAGFVLYTLGARHDIAVTAVLVSLFGAVAAILARLVFEERLARVQTAGIATIVAGISTLSLLGS